MKTTKKSIDFAQNMNSLGAPKGISRATLKHIDSLFRYPNPKDRSLDNLLAKFIGVKDGSATHSNGSTQLIFDLPKFLNRKSALIIKPTFWEYEVSNKRSEIVCSSLFLRENDNFVLDIEDFTKNIKRDSVVYLCNPNNPTSTLFDRKKVLDIVIGHKETYFVIDETYLIFREDYDKLTMTKEAQKLDNLYIVGSLSKIFAIPGIRSGFLISSPENISRYCEWRIPYTNSTLSEEIVKWIISQKSYLLKTRKYFTQARKEFAFMLKKQLSEKLDSFRPEANFVLAKILKNQESTKIVKALKTRGFAVRDGSGFPGLGNKWLRFTIRTEKENHKLISALNNVLK